MAELMRVVSVKADMSPISSRTRVNYTLECGCQPRIVLPDRHTAAERTQAIKRKRMKCLKHPWRPIDKQEPRT